MARGRLRELVVLGGLYAAQGLPYGFVTQALPVMLRELGTSLALIGLSNLLAAPWALKPLWAPLVERTGTLRRWLLGLQAVSALAMLALAAVDPRQGMAVLAALVLLSNLLSASQDVATDALGVTTLTAESRGWGNGLQVAGYRVGMIVGGGALLVVFERYGWTPAVAGIAVGLVLCTLPLVVSDLGREPARPSPGFAWDWLARPGALAWVGLLGAFKVGDYLVQGMLRPWLVDRGMDAGDIGLLVGGAGFTAGLLGAMAGGALVGPLGRVRSLVLFGIAQAAILAVYAAEVAFDAPDAAVWAAVLAEHAVSGLLTTALFTAMMDASREDRAATDYALQAAAVVVAQLGAASVSGLLAVRFGYAELFALGAVVALVGPALAVVPAATRILRPTPGPGSPDRA